jgi:hypothetical protein
VPTYQAVGTFEVAAWTGNYASYSQSEANGGVAGLTPSFANHEGEPSADIVPQPISGNGSLGPGGWNGNLELAVPEPSTFVLGGFGMVALWFFRRRR